MNTINELINVLKILIGLGVTARLIFCLIKMMYAEEERISYKRKMGNTIVFGVLAELCLVIKDLVMFYYKG